MSKQLHAPPTEEEYRDHWSWGSPRPREEIQVWPAVGWCSSCRSEPVDVVHMGVEKRNFALCRDCVARLSAGFDAPPNEGGGSDG